MRLTIAVIVLAVVLAGCSAELPAPKPDLFYPEAASQEEKFYLLRRLPVNRECCGDNGTVQQWRKEPEAGGPWGNRTDTYRVLPMPEAPCPECPPGTSKALPVLRYEKVKE